MELRDAMQFVSLAVKVLLPSDTDFESHAVNDAATQCSQNFRLSARGPEGNALGQRRAMSVIATSIRFICGSSAEALPVRGQ